MTTTHTYPPETAEGHKQKTPIFSMDNIAASATRRIQNFLDWPLSEDNHLIGKPTATPVSSPDNLTIIVLPTPSVLLHQMISHTIGGPAYSIDTRRTQIHTPQHLNPHPTGGNLLPQNSTIPGAKLIPSLTLSTDTIMVTKVMTSNQAAQMNPEVQVVQKVLEAPMVWEVQVVLATILPTSKTFCRNL